jgi:HEAT repeat protein
VACGALSAAGVGAGKAAPAVARLLEDADASVRDGALRVLSNLGPAAGDVAAGVAARLADSDPEVRKSAANALAHVARGAEAMQPVLALFADPQAEVREAAGWALLRQPAGPASLSVLMRALADPNTSVAGIAAMAIGKLGAPAKDAVSSLGRLLESPDSTLRQRAAAGLKGLGPTAAAATPRLVTALGHEETAGGKRTYLAALEAIGPAAKAALPAVERCAKDQDDGVREAAQATLAALRVH